MEPLINLHDLLQHEIEDLYSAEEQIIEALPKMVENATDRELKQALNEHLQVTREQKKRLDKVKKLLGIDEKKKGFFAEIFGGTKCKGTEGLIAEGEKMMGQEMDPTVKDAAIIAAAQKIEHYEISGYGTARTYARELGLNEAADLLETTLNEEYKADDSLTSLAINKINLEAEAGGGPRMVTSNKKTSGTNKKGSGVGARNGVRKDAKNAKKPALKKTTSKGTRKAIPKKGSKKSARKKTSAR